MFYSIISNIYTGVYYFTDLVAFISIHIFVMYKKKFQIYLTDYKNILIIAVSLVLIVGWIVGINYIGSHVNIFSNFNLLLCKYNNPIIIVMSMAVLDIAVKKECHYKIINSVCF